MEIKRTANAGVLLGLGGKRILIDGVCREIKPYLATPPQMREALLKELPDALLFTHSHTDHYDAAFVSEYLQKTAGPVLGPADIPFCSAQTCQIGDVQIMPVPSRHIGKTELIGHISFVLKGSRCVWFLGDASPLFWKGATDLPCPDVMIGPYAYGMGSGWEVVKRLGAKEVVLLHLPMRDNDPYGLWPEVERTAGQAWDIRVHFPEMGESIAL